MLNPDFIRTSPDLVKEGVKKRGLNPDLVEQWLKIDQQWRNLLLKIDQLRAKRNQLAEQIKQVGGKPTLSEIAQGRKLKKQIQQLEGELAAIEIRRQELLYQIPNLPAEDVPLGKDDRDNVEIKRWGQPPQFDFQPKDHLTIGEELGIIDKKRAAKVSGPRFGYFKADGALLEFALMWYIFNKLTQKGFTPVIPPVMIKKEVERGLGYVEHGGWDQVYLFEKDNLVFVASSEHSVIPMHQDEVFSPRDLPLRYVNFSVCFRREAGTYGKDTQGLFRVHQFNKVEMNVYTLPDTGVSDQEWKNLLALQEEIMQDLGLPYRVVLSCTGDLPFPNRRMVDIEAWFPGQCRYRETHSCSNCTDFQTRRLNIKVRQKGKLEYVHALNATAITDRALLAILENYQQKDGSVIIPPVLRPWLKKEVIRKKKLRRKN